VRLFDVLRHVPTAEGRAMLWTRLAHRRDLHQTTAQTSINRYPQLFDLALRLAPGARRILSFGCSTGEELIALRQRFPSAAIIGAEINPRSRRMAARAVAEDPGSHVVAHDAIRGSFDAIFALAVLQRLPVTVEETGMADLSHHYPFARFDAAVTALAQRLETGGLLCVFHCHYRVEDSAAATMLDAIPESPPLEGRLFGPDGRLLGHVDGRSIFRKHQ
jgi:cyclopropane fatty-acyl-phospholipid synthase-like methyltransferase